MRNIMFTCFYVWLLLGIVTAAKARPFQKGDYEFSLAATGTSSSDVDSFTSGGSASLGTFLTKNAELSIRQSASYSDTGKATWLLSTVGGFDWNFDGFDKFVPFVGGFAGPSYGDIAMKWFGGGEGGVKYFLSDSTLLTFTAQYATPFDGDGNGEFRYALALAWRW